jgi:hypothetical protein
MMSRVILGLAFAAFARPFAISLPTNDDAWEELAVAVPKAENVILDAGSGGTKIFAYVDGKTWDNANLDSVCDPKGTHSNKGLAVLPYNPGKTASTCHERFQLWGVRPTSLVGNAKLKGTDILPAMVAKMNAKGYAKTANVRGSPVPQIRCSSGTPAGCVTKFRKFLIQGIDSYYSVVHAGQPKSDHGGEATNAGAVPIVATAGMRMLDQHDNDVVWGGLCGTSGNKPTGTNYNLAPKGTNCGTISGTTEAFYEYKGYQSKVASGAPYEADRGTFTIGGASAQIAFPITTPEQEKEFKELVAKAAEKIDCEMMLVASGKPAPKFGGGLKQLELLIGKKEGYTEDNKGCVPDYIDMKTTASSAKSPTAQKIATISFLNLAADKECTPKLLEVLDTCLNQPMKPEDKKAASCLAAKQRCAAPIAGGAQEMANWASNNCKTGNAEACTTKLTATLARDGFWGAVTSWFASQATLGVEKFAYATDNANQKVQDKTATGAGKLEAKVGTKCKDFSGAGKSFDWNGKKDESEDCVKAIWAKMYLTSFFGSASHPKTQAEMGPNSDWANGFPMELLEVENLNDDVSFHYTDGFFYEL